MLKRQDKINVRVTVESLSHHLSQIYTGFELLKKTGTVDLHYQFPSRMKRMHFMAIADIEGEKVVFDLKDSVDIDENVYQTCEFYFKRMLAKEDLPTHPKIFPLGFNNAVYYPIPAFLRVLFRASKQRTIRQVFRFNRPLSLAVFNKESAINCNPSSLESPPNCQLPDKVFFSARLWDPDTFFEQERKEECHEINQHRISLVKNLKEAFNDKFVGGIVADRFSHKICPGLLLPKSFSNKASYLKHLRKCTIGIASPGIYNSVGWKFTEYISNSCAIVTSPIDDFVFPGDFKEKENYFSYRNLDECISKVDMLLKNRDLKNGMMNNNHQYHKNYVTPEKLVSNVLARVLGV